MELGRVRSSVSSSATAVDRLLEERIERGTARGDAKARSSSEILDPYSGEVDPSATGVPAARGVLLAFIVKSTAKARSAFLAKDMSIRRLTQEIRDIESRRARLPDILKVALALGHLSGVNQLALCENYELIE